jgi:hypothetical protein
VKNLIIEQPSLHLEWQKDNGENYICSAIRTNYSKISPLTIASIAKQAGLEVDAVDMKIRDKDIIQPYKKFRYGDGLMVASRKGIPFEKLESKIRDADILSFSINPTQWADISLDFVNYAKSINPKIKTIIGGTDALTRFDHYLSKGIDFVILGEGEQSGKKLFENLSQGKKDFSDIPNIAYFDNRQIKRNPRSFSKFNLDERPFQDFESFKQDVHLWNTPIEYWPLPKGASGPIGFIEFSRGCLENCGYCTTPIKNKGFRVENMNSLEKRLNNYKQWGINTLSIWDDNLGSLIKQGREEEIVDIINLLKEKGFAFEYSQGNMAISYLWDENKNQPKYKLIESIFSTNIQNDKFVGNYGMYFPFENLQTENPKDAYKKLMSFDKELAILDAALDAGLESVSYGTIIGVKGDNQENLSRAKSRIHEINDLVKGKGKNGLAIPFCYMPIPKTKFFSSYKQDIVYSLEEYPELMGLNVSLARTENYEPHEITQMKIDMEKEFLTKKEFEHWRSTGEYYWETD